MKTSRKVSKPHPEVNLYPVKRLFVHAMLTNPNILDKMFSTTSFIKKDVATSVLDLDKSFAELCVSPESLSLHTLKLTIDLNATVNSVLDNCSVHTVCSETTYRQIPQHIVMYEGHEIVTEGLLGP